MILPPTLDAAALAQLLPLGESTILRDVSHPLRANNLPPFVRLGKKKIWLSPVVLHCMTEGQSLEFIGISVAHIPPLLDVAQLAKLLYLSVKTVKLYASQFPDRLPPSIPGRREKRWVASVVLDWLVGRLNRLCEVDFGGLIVSASSRNHQQEPGVQMDSLAGLVQTTMRATGSGMGGMR